MQRWLIGRVPHPRHRWAIANLLGEDEGYLWPAARPDLSPGAEATSEVVAAYGHRADIPNTRWSDVMATARRQIDLLGYAFLFLPEQFVDLSLSIEHKCASGCKVRIALADPDGTQTQERDALEQLDGTLPGADPHDTRPPPRCPDDSWRGAPVPQRAPLQRHLSLRRRDDRYAVPVPRPWLPASGFRLRRLGPYGVFASFADQFEAIWATAAPAAGNPVRWSISRGVNRDECDYYHDPNAPRLTPWCPGRLPLSSTMRARSCCTGVATMPAGRCLVASWTSERASLRPSRARCGRRPGWRSSPSTSSGSTQTRACLCL